MNTSSLLTAAATIRDETADYQNTALRVGSLFASIVTAFSTLEEELKAAHTADSTSIHQSLQALRQDLTEAQAAILENFQSIKDGAAAQQEAKKEAAALSASLQALRQDHESLVDDVSVNRSDIERYAKDLAQNAKNIAHNADDISSLRSTAQTLRTDLSTAETDIRHLETAQATHTRQIEALQSSLQHQAADISSLRSTALENQRAANSLASEQQTLAVRQETQAADIRSLTADLRRAEAEIEALKKTGGGSATLPDGTDITQLVADVELLKKRLII